jgi:hypothetical protein
MRPEHTLVEHLKNSMVGLTHNYYTRLAGSQSSSSFAGSVSDGEEKGFMTLAPGLPPNM